MKIGLGTVQFGCNYGISNKNGQVSLAEINKILEYAKTVNIDTLDTACMYGNAEEILGKFDLHSFKIITKTTRANIKENKEYNITQLEKKFEASLKKLNLNKVYGLLFHETDDLISDIGDSLWRKVEEFKNNNQVAKIGVSVYTPAQLDYVIKRYPIDIVQLPLNILDQRFVQKLKDLKSRNIEIHTRSTFLQGLILMPLEQVDTYFDKIKPLLNTIPEPKLAYAVQFADNIKEVDKVIVGTTCINDLKEIVEATNQDIKSIDYGKYKVSDEKYILPQNWKLD